MKTELAKLIDKWEIEKGSYIPNAPIYQAFIDEAKEALERESKVNNVVLDAVSNSDNKKAVIKIDNAILSRAISYIGDDAEENRDAEDLVYDLRGMQKSCY